jgi:CII-binding regulator of phage lambda lysogenization HflD
MRRSASEIISNLETRIAGLEKQSSYTEREVIDAMSKFKNLYESGFMSKTD